MGYIKRLYDEMMNAPDREEAHRVGGVGRSLQEAVTEMLKSNGWDEKQAREKATSLIKEYGQGAIQEAKDLIY